MKYIFLALILFCYGPAPGQLTATGNDANILSLLTQLKKSKQDTSQVNLLNELGYEYSVSNFHKAKIYLTHARLIAQKQGFKRGLADALSYLGIAYETQGDYFEALNAQIAALKIREEIGDSIGISYSVHYIGDIYFGQADLSDKPSSREDFNKKALEQFYRSLNIAEAINDQKSIANTLNCIGNSFREKGDFETALGYYNKTVSIREKIGDKINLSTTFVNIGKLYLKQGDHAHALEYLYKALGIADELSHKRTCVKALGTIGSVYFMQKKYAESIDFTNRSLALAGKIGYLEYMAKANKLLSQIYSASDFAGRNGDKALAFYKNYIVEKDSIDIKKATQVELQYEFDKKEELAKVEHAKQIAIAEEEQKKQRLITWFVVGGLLIVLFFAAFIFRSLQVTRRQKITIEQKELETQQQKTEIEHKQKEILDSIAYAKRLQEAILPSRELISENVPGNFILYKPKDIVAGDFYWAEKLGNNFFIAAADCTGHGVPGSLVSVVCSNALNRSVKEFGLSETGKILDKTRELVIETLAKNDPHVKDGMDISLLCINKNEQKISWSGANNPLWYILENKVTEITANKQPVGMSYETVPFTTSQIDYKPGTVFYLFTDGLADQFGGPKGKKFKYKQFEELLLSISTMSLPQQSITIERAFENWKGPLEQVDDICIIGVRI